jgi:dinuclear metal center YbgI/SA1388 family protein
LGLASSWDNVGLQVGLPAWKADKILLTLDVTPKVVAYAVEKKFELILSHHPFIFKPISAVTRPEIVTLIEHQIAVIALHTNLDVVPKGVNYALAEALGIKVTGFLSSETGSQWYHGSVTVPPLYLDKLAEAIHSAGAGRIGFYDNCSTRHETTGTFRAMEGSSPYLGKQGIVEMVNEIELEFMVDSFNLSAVKKAIASVHPYETPAVYFVEVQNNNPAYGLGLVCELNHELSLADFAGHVKRKLKAPFVQLWKAGKEDTTLVKKVAVCGGAGGSLINQATGAADVYVTGDINYHAMLESRIPLINAGHFYTEYPILAKLSKLLSEQSITSAIFPTDMHEVNGNILL